MPATLTLPPSGTRSGRFVTATVDQAALGLVAWEGVLAVEGRPTGDGRQFAVGALRWGDEQPLPVDLFAMLADPDGGWGHDGSEICGRIDEIWRTDEADDTAFIRARGVYDTGSDVGAEVVRLQRLGMLTGVSIDVDDIEVQMPDVIDDVDIMDLLFGFGPEIYSAGRIRRATVCSIPAFIEAKIEPVDSAGALVASPVAFPAGVRVWTPTRGFGTDRAEVALTAAGAGRFERRSFGGRWSTEDPPAELFERQTYSEYTPFTIDADGRLSGHICRWTDVHIGFTGRTVTPPRTTCDYRHARAGGHVLTAEGRMVPTARLFAQFTPGRRGHAEERGVDAQAAVEWYENMTACCADVVPYDDDHGIQLQGRLRDVPREWVVALRGSDLSPDWRWIGGRLEAVAFAAVNVSGFPSYYERLPALAASAVALGVDVHVGPLPEMVGDAWVIGGQVRALVASPVRITDQATAALALVGRVEQLAARVEQLEQAALAAEAAALCAGLPSAADEAAALLSGLDLDAPPAPAEHLTVNSIEVQADPVAQFDRIVAAVAGALGVPVPPVQFAAAVECPDCGWTGPEGMLKDGACPECGAVIDG